MADNPGPANGAPLADAPKPYLTPEAYLAREREAEFKSEYFDGEMISLPGASLNHSRIKDNLAAELRARFVNLPYEALTSDVKVWTAATGDYFYPDVVVIGGAADLLGEPDFITASPLAVVEVSSPSTERYDRNEKFASNQTVTTLKEILMISQDEPLIERFERQPDGTWKMSAISGATNDLVFATIPLNIPLKDIYARVKFPANVPRAPLPS